jgi:hypothetical protein
VKKVEHSAEAARRLRMYLYLRQSYFLHCSFLACLFCYLEIYFYRNCYDLF